MKESELKHAVEEYLQYQQNLGRLLFLRLNAGDFIEVRGNTRRRIKGCPKGTADLLVLKWSPFLMQPMVVFLELKSEKGKQSPEQVEFQQVAVQHGAEYYIVYSAAEVMEIVG